MEIAGLRDDLAKLGSDMPDNEKKLLVARLADDLGDELPRNRMEILAKSRGEIATFLNNCGASTMDYIRGALDAMGMVCAAYMNYIRDDFERRLRKKIEKTLCPECQMIYFEHYSSVWPRGICDKCLPKIEKISQKTMARNFYLITKIKGQDAIDFTKKFLLSESKIDPELQKFYKEAKKYNEEHPIK